MLAVELGVNLSLTKDTLHLLPAPRLPLTTLFESEAGQRPIFGSFDMGYARPPILSADFSYTGEGFAAFFEIRFDTSSWAFDGGDRAVPSGGVVSEPGGIPLFS